MRRRILLATVVILAALCALAALLGPSVAGGMLEDKLKSSLTKREVPLEWQALDVDWQGRVVMRDLKFEDAKLGGKVTIDRVTIVPALRTMFSETPQIKRVAVAGIKGSVDAATLRAYVKQLKDKQGSGEVKPPAASSRAAMLKRALMERPPQVEVSDAALDVTYRGVPVARLTSKQAQVTPRGGALEVKAEGELVPQLMLLPEVFRQTRKWGAEGTVSLKDRAAKLSVASSEKGKALLEFMVPGVGEVHIGSLGADVAAGEAKRARLSMSDTFVRAGTVEAPALLLSANKAEVDITDPRSPLFHMQGGTMELDPTQINELRELPGKLGPSLKGALGMMKAQLDDGGDGEADGAQLGALGDLFKKKQPGDKKKQGAKKGKRGKKREPTSKYDKIEQQLARALRILWRADFVAEDSTFTVRYEDPEQGTRKIKLVEHLSVTARAGTIIARGASAGGSFSGMAQFIPDQAMPISATIQAKDVQIERVPIISQGRSLPNRGIRGKLGGKVDVSAVLVSPTTGVARKDASARVDFLVGLAWRDGMIDLHGLADAPLTGISLDTEFTLRWEMGLNRIALRDGVAHYGPLTGHYNISVIDLPYRPFVAVSASLDEAECQDMALAFPEALRGPYKDVKLEGRAAPWFKFTLPVNDPYRLTLLVGGLRDLEKMKKTLRKEYFCKITALNATKDAWPTVRFQEPPSGLERQSDRPLENPPPGRSSGTLDDVYWLNRPFVKRVEEGVWGSREIYVGPGTETYVPLNDMPPYVGAAMFLSEEIVFRSNRGLSFGLIAQALRINIDRGRFVYGGSTVTQQLVKNLFLTRKKTLARKLQEAFIALRIDEVVSKQRLLELYLNCIEFGPNIYGIGPAAKYYFQKEAKDLTPIEAVFLAVLKPSPSYGGHLRRRGYTPGSGHMPERMAVIFDRLIEYNFIKPEDKEAARPFVIKWDGDGNVIRPKAKTAGDEMLDMLPIDTAATPAAP